MSTSLRQQLQNKIDQKTKPLGSLGKLEQVALQIGLIQQSLTPSAENAKAFIFGADHGVCDEGVSLFPQQVTSQMLANFAAGGAAMNVFCRSNGIDLELYNMGIVDTDARWPGVHHCSVAAGTNNMRHGPAMTQTQCQQALLVGREAAQRAAAQGHQIIIIGEMGIGNTTAASALLSALTGLDSKTACGPGTGVGADVIALKAQVVADAVSRCQGLSAAQILAQVGGFEIAAMAGVLLEAKHHQLTVLVDGFIASAAALVAEYMEPNSKSNWLFSHASAEPAHSAMLQALDAEALIDLKLRLGEGTGSALAYPLVKCAVAMLNEMASFADAGVSSA
ncbi:nicotinate-nucleotide--dimethylbenzimidazole phosphoribosyltransferase [Neiella marina]|uniref:Nicotinate-nucleotide--dimethylbenzimidazole phosphoribosyltransferase n=1 Tax=Neiella marina TaxID=508461 RepID=A0A8J2U427_9GAMM|nr:nicotinate-nucleotide--dimethylbenzimidazole phosphoribosyltransferase [Neiella marina]GGA72421.1 nicotinate-nucleotide--dimethylbenzimidazole phosphoribosyltransferase [Neiella marina]